MRKHQRSSYFGVFLFSLLCTSLLFAQQFNFRNYSVDDGVGQSQVYALHQDSRGYLWLGTRGGGLTKFDGENFKSYTVKDGLVNNYISSIVEDSSKNLWIGTNDGLSYYDGLNFKNFKPKDSLPIAISEIVYDENGLMWIGSNKGIFTFDGKTISKYNTRITMITAMFRDRKGNIWVGNGRGVYKITVDDNKIKAITEKNSQWKNSVTCFEEDKDRNLWVGTYGDGLYVYNGRSFRRIDNANELYRVTVLDIYDDNAGSIWIATLNNGVCRYNVKEKSFNWLTEREGLSNNHVRCIERDTWGNYWFGTSGGGVCNYYGQLFTHYTKENGLRANFIYEIFRDKDGMLWLANGDKGVCAYDDHANGTSPDQKFTCYGEDEGFVNFKVRAIDQEENGHLLFGTDGQGIYVFNGETFSELSEFRKKFIRDIKRDKNGFVWVATAGNGLYKFKLEGSTIASNSLLNLTTKEKLPHNRLSCLHVDRKNRVWIGTENNGVALVVDDKIVYNITIADGIAANSIRCIDEDKNGYLWIGTAGNGISCIPIYKENWPIKNFDHKSGLTSSNVYLLAHEGSDFIFVGTEAGLDRLKLDKEYNIIDVKHYSKAEGFTGIETCQGAVHYDSGGAIWFGTINGLSKYNPRNKIRNAKPPKIEITDVRLFYDPFAKTEYAELMGEWNKPVKKIVLPSDQNHLTFDFIGLNFPNPEKVVYQWQLEGFDESWSPKSNQRTVTYSNIPPGNYTFKLKACNEDEVWTPAPVQLSFSILRPFWMQWWFITASVISSGGLLTLVYRRRLKIVNRKNEEQRHKLELEKNMLELEQKALRLQMNPHFIFNALNSIQAQIGDGNEQTARYYLAKFAKLMRRILDNSRVPLITLEEEIETLDNYLLIEKFAGGDIFDYEIKINEGSEKDYIKIPPMLLQPFAENAIKHGFKNLDRRGRLEINFEEKEGYIECSISDNGIGREKAGELKQKSEAFHKSTALMVTQDRLDLLRKIEKEKLIEILDYEIGTRVIIRIPY